jgi:hypothetical protein
MGGTSAEESMGSASGGPAKRHALPNAAWLASGSVTSTLDQGYTRNSALIHSDTGIA